MLVLVHDEGEQGGAQGGLARAAETLRQMQAAFPTAPCKCVVPGVRLVGVEGRGGWTQDLYPYLYPYPRTHACMCC